MVKQRRVHQSKNTLAWYLSQSFERGKDVVETHGRCIRWKPKSNRCPSKGYPEVLGNGLCMACWDKSVDHKQSARQQLG